MKENPDIDELLNSFIEGELTERHRVEVQRLIKHDPQIAHRMQELQKCKMLVSSLPRADAPVEIIARVKASLKARALLGPRARGSQPPAFDERKGARYLLARKILAAAAMLGLVAILTVLVYTIVVPQSAVETGTVAKGWPEPIGPKDSIGETVGVERPGSTLVAAVFYGRLELETDDVVRVDAFINRAIEDNGFLRAHPDKPLNYAGPRPVSRRDKNIYALSCSREALSLLLADLGSIWQKFDSATLSIETDRFGEQVVVNSVNTEQIAEIIEQDSLGKRIEVAKNFAVLNDMADLIPGKELFAAINDTGLDLITPPKPRLTWDRGTIKSQPRPVEEGQKVHLTIVIVGSR